MYEVKTTPDFDRDMKELDQPVADRIIEKIEWLADHPELLKHPLKHMPQNLKGLQKYKVGNYRVLLWADRNNKMLTLYGVEHRRKVYKKL